MTKTDILDAINRLLVEQWPTRTVYVDVCPVDFERPSFWLAVEKDDQTDANRVLIRHDLQLRLTRVLTVGERHLKLQLKTLPRDPDRAYIQINTSWLDNRPEQGTGTEAPIAEKYSIRVTASTK